MFEFIPVVEFICFLFAAFFLRNSGNITWTVIKWFMLFTVLTEIAGVIMAYFQPNIWIFNLYTFVNFFTLYWVVYKLLPAHRYNYRLYISGIIIFCIVSLIEIVTKGFFINNTISDTTSSLLFVIIANWFFYLLLQKDEWIEIYNHAAFWFVTGLLLFSFCTIATDLFENQLTNLFITPVMSLRYLLYIVFNLILYGCWSYAFVCKYQETI